MANYVIEGTVSEVTVKESEVSVKKIESKETGTTKKETELAVKIVGSEGYAIKQGDKTYNVFCLENMPKKYFHGYIVDSRIEFTMDEKFEKILTQASTHGKKIRLAISANLIEKYLQKCVGSNTEQGANDNGEVDMKSVTLLQK